MDLLEKILNSKDEDIDEIIKNAIDEKNKGAEKVEQLGFLDYGKSNHLFKGFIPLDTRIKYSSMNIETYSMKTTDFMYEFAHFIKQYNISSKGNLIKNLEYFINSYFGMPGKIDREEIFADIAWNNTKTDEEYFEALENNQIGDLKKKGAAQCTERGALAQQILSLFNTETYYCMGCVDLGKKQEPHCFNIVKRKNDYALLDYSCPVTSFDKDGKPRALYPFVGTLSNEEFEEFITTGKIKNYKNYEFNELNGRIVIDSERLYVVGEYSIDKEKYYENRKKDSIIDSAIESAVGTIKAEDADRQYKQIERLQNEKSQKAQEEI